MPRGVTRGGWPRPLRMPLSWPVERRFERFFMPPVSPAELSDALADAPQRVDDFRRVVYFVALVAVAFFIPSLLIANVPTEHWLSFIVSAAVACTLLTVHAPDARGTDSSMVFLLTPGTNAPR